MLAVRHIYRRLLAEHREHKKDTTRSPHWPAVREAHLRLHSTCAGCGSTGHLQVHHVFPFSTHPELELEPSNLVTACMSPAECHLFICHGDDFKHHNPHVRADLAELLRYPARRPMIVARAKAKRLIG